MSVIEPSRKYWALGFGLAYLAAAAFAGFRLDVVWNLFGGPDAAGQGHHFASVATTVFPHILAVCGVVLLIAGRRVSRAAFALIALGPVAYVILCLAIRVQY